MRKITLSLVVCAFAALSLSQVKLGSPAQTVQSLVSALESGKVNDAAKCVQNAKPTAQVKRNLETIPSQGVKLVANVQTPTIKGSKATATVTITVRMANQPSRSTTESVEFAKVGNSWLIVAPKTMPSPQSAISGIACMLVNGESSMMRPAQSDKTSVCMMNAKQLGLGCMMYAADYDDVYKFKASGWTNAIMPYIKNKAILTCPLDKPGTISYSFNASLIGKNQAVIGRPAETVMIYEGKNKKLLYRHGGKAVVVFADGHANLVSKEEANNLVWKL